MFEITVPEFGESIQEVQVGQWLKEVGQWVEKDEDIVELESDKATQALAAPEAGVIQEIKVEAGGFAQVGDLLCIMDTNAGGVAATPTATAAKGGQAAATTATAPVSGGGAGSATWIMPAAERVLDEYKISADAITPSGPGGRLQKEDVLRYIEAHGLKPGGSGATSSGKSSAPAPAPPTQPAANDAFSSPAGVPAAPAQATPQTRATAPPAGSSVASQSKEFNTMIEGGDRVEKVVPMSMIRRTIANRLVQAQQTAALLTTFNEINMKPVMDLRKKYKEAFLKKHGVKLGFMSFFAKAAVESLKRFPAINSEVQGNNVIWKNYHDIGIAIGGGKGLVVPVLRNVERMSFADVEQQIGEYAALAQANKVTPADLQGGTFTISNGGVYGSLLSTPIVNPPQSGILGLHTIQERPIALNGEVVIRPMMYVALTYDHRIVDGKEAVGFLKTIKEVLEEPARLFLEV